jgi:hypothetical protein
LKKPFGPNRRSKLSMSIWTTSWSPSTRTKV